MGWMALVVTSSTLAMYLLLYTAYSKMNKTLEPSLLIAVLTMSEGLEHTLLELNKAISLAGLTVLALAFCPGFYEMQVHLLWHAMILLWTHSCYSAYQFYGGTNIPRLSEFPSMCKELVADDAKTRAVGMKKLSIILGTAGQLVLSAGYWGYIGARLLCWMGVGLGTAHFYTMEIDYKWVLQVRPFAYLPFVLATIAVLWN